MIEEIVPNLYRIEIPLPKNPLKVTNSFVLTSDDRNLIIDTGFNRKECLDALTAGIGEIKLDLNRTDFFATHLHADHQGLIPTLAVDDAKLYMGSADAQRMESGGGFHEMLEHGKVHGFPTELLQDAMMNHPGHKHGPERIVKWIHVTEGMTITVGDFTLECLETPGHSWGHICLYEPHKRILFSGDHILGDITPNIQVWTHTDNPLKKYMESLTKVGKLDVELTLPGHRSLIPDCDKRIAELKTHHLNRCNEVLDILRTESLHGYDTASRMTWDIKAKSWEDFPLMQKWFATGEAMAHLRFLEQRGLIDTNPGDDGVYLYSLANGDARLESVD